MPETPTACLFSPSLLVTVTIEAGSDGRDEIHFHMGGQGFWVARALRNLGQRPILCAPIGGESGQVIRGLIGSTGLDFSPVAIDGDSSAYVHDRREGAREEVAASRHPKLDRHELDDLFARTLQHSLASGVCVVTGRRPGDNFPLDFYRHLGLDLAAAGVRTAGDLHGEELMAFLDGGPMEVLKVSDEDLVADGLLSDGCEDGAVWAAIERLTAAGARAVVVSLGARGALAGFQGMRLRASPPELEVVDSTGAGDSMTAALVVSMIRGLDPEESMRLASAAGAANVTRHGLGSAPVELINRLAELVEVDRVEA